MKNVLRILNNIFNIADTLMSSTLYAGIILTLTLFVWMGFLGLSETYEAQFIWELAIFAFTFFSLFHFFLKKEKYSFNDYVISLVPFSALLLIMSTGFIYHNFRTGILAYAKIGVVLMNFGMVILSFALSHTTILVFRNQLKN